MGHNNLIVTILLPNCQVYIVPAYLIHVPLSPRFWSFDEKFHSHHPFSQPRITAFSIHCTLHQSRLLIAATALDTLIFV